MKKRILIALGVLVLAAGIGAGGWYYYTSCRGRRRQNDIVYVTKISKLSEMDSGGKPICRCCGTAGNGSGKDRKRPKGKSSGKDRSGSQKERAAFFSMILEASSKVFREAQLAPLKNEQSDQITTLKLRKESYSR